PEGRNVRAPCPVSCPGIRRLPKSLKVEQHLPDNALISQTRPECQFGTGTETDQDDLGVTLVLKPIKGTHYVSDNGRIRGMVCRTAGRCIAFADAPDIKP